MCKEDVRIGRKLAAVTTTRGVPQITSPLLLVRANPDRGRLVVAITGAGGANALDGPSIRYGGVTGPVLATTSAGLPSFVMTVEEYGELLLGELWATVVTDRGYTLYATELVWLEELNKL